MDDLNLTSLLQKKMAVWPRVRGRYNSSELYAIIAGWTTPEQWFAPVQADIKGLLQMWNGTGIHNQLQKLIGEEFSEAKRVFPYKGLTLVAKADYLPPDKPEEVWEFKTSDKVIEKAKPWHEYQVKLYTSMFDKKKGLVFQPVQRPDGLFLRHLGTMDRDDDWFEQQLEKLYQFHLQVEELWDKKLKDENSKVVSN